MDKTTIRADRSKFQTGLNWILVLLSLLAIAAILLIGPDALHDLSVSLRSQLMANYGAEPFQLSVQSLQLSIFEDVLRDLGFVPGAGDGLDEELQVDLVGTGPYRSELEKIAIGLRTKANIRFRGWVEPDSKELYDFFEQSNIFVLPSSSENFPMVLLQAMAASQAIITTSGTGCQEVVGDHARLVRPRSPREIRDALIELLHEPGLAERIGNAARLRLETNFTWKVVAESYVDMYQRVISEGDD